MPSESRIPVLQFHLRPIDLNPIADICICRKKRIFPKHGLTKEKPLSGAEISVTESPRESRVLKDKTKGNKRFMNPNAIAEYKKRWYEDKPTKVRVDVNFVNFENWSTNCHVSLYRRSRKITPKNSFGKLYSLSIFWSEDTGLIPS